MKSYLLNCMKHVGVSSSCLSWFKSYLSERYQTVRINSTLSDKLTVVSGVPQVSILVPLLFSIYVNDLSSSIKKCSSESYVDDTKLLLSFHINNSSTAVVDLNGDLVRTRNWCFDNLLLLNPEKTKLMIYGSRQMLAKLPEFRISLLGKDLTPSKSVKDLGVTFDPVLSFDDHILSTVSSCNSTLGQINRAKHAFSKSLPITVINCLVFSKLYYCSSALVIHLLYQQRPTPRSSEFCSTSCEQFQEIRSYHTSPKRSTLDSCEITSLLS